MLSAREFSLTIKIRHSVRIPHVHIYKTHGSNTPHVHLSEESNEVADGCREAGSISKMRFAASKEPAPHRENARTQT